MRWSDVIIISMQFPGIIPETKNHIRQQKEVKNRR
jgi:hypothetical protein